MAKRGSVELKITGGEIVQINVKVSRGVIESQERLKVTFKGLKGDQRTKLMLMVPMAEKESYPLGAITMFNYEIPQTEMPLGDNRGKANGARAAASAS